MAFHAIDGRTSLTDYRSPVTVRHDGIKRAVNMMDNRELGVLPTDGGQCGAISKYQSDQTSN
jgi:hypothetical protein